MNKINHNRLEKIEKLYKNGQVEIPSRKFLEAMSSVELEEFIQKAERTPKRTYQPLGRELRNTLTGMIKKGILDIPLEDLEFMSKSVGENYYTMGMMVNENSVISCTRMQCKRMRSMMKEGLIEPIPENRLKILSCNTAKAIIREGENQAARRRVSAK